MTETNRGGRTDGRRRGSVFGQPQPLHWVGSPLGRHTSGKATTCHLYSVTASGRGRVPKLNNGTPTSCNFETYNLTAHQTSSQLLAALITLPRGGVR